MSLKTHRNLMPLNSLSEDVVFWDSYNIHLKSNGKMSSRTVLEVGGKSAALSCETHLSWQLVIESPNKLSYPANRASLSLTCSISSILYINCLHLRAANNIWEDPEPSERGEMSVIVTFKISTKKKLLSIIFYFLFYISIVQIVSTDGWLLLLMDSDSDTLTRSSKVQTMCRAELI